MSGLEPTLCTLLIYYKAIYHVLNLLLVMQCIKMEKRRDELFFVCVCFCLSEISLLLI